MLFLSSLLTCILALTATALPYVAVKRQVTQLRDHYDFIIAGGGTAGLTVADRLTEALPHSEHPSRRAGFDIIRSNVANFNTDLWFMLPETVLVVEYGEIEYAPGMFDPPTIVWNGNETLASGWTFYSLPNPEINNKTAFLKVGQVVGGSSAINGMFFDRGSRFDFEAVRTF